MSHTQTFDLSYTALCHLIIKFLVFKIFQKKKKRGGMHSNRVTTTELTHVKRINKYLLFRPHISVEYNNISNPFAHFMCFLTNEYSLETIALHAIGYV